MKKEVTRITQDVLVRVLLSGARPCSLAGSSTGPE